MSEALPNIAKVIKDLEGMTVKKRRLEVARLLKDSLDDQTLTTGEGKEFLHRRALLVSELRKRDLWP